MYYCCHTVLQEGQLEYGTLSCVRDILRTLFDVNRGLRRGNRGDVQLMMTNITCQLFANKIICNGSVFVEEEKKLTYEDEWFWIYLGIYVGLVLLAGILTHSRIFSMSSFAMLVRFIFPSYLSSFIPKHVQCI